MSAGYASSGREPSTGPLESIQEIGGRVARSSGDIVSIRNRLRMINAALTGASVPDNTSGPKAVRSGIVGNLEETSSEIASNILHITDELDRLERTFGIDQPPTNGRG